MLETLNGLNKVQFMAWRIVFGVYESEQEAQQYAADGRTPQLTEQEWDEVRVMVAEGRYR